MSMTAGMDLLQPLAQNAGILSIRDGVDDSSPADMWRTHLRMRAGTARCQLGIRWRRCLDAWRDCHRGHTALVHANLAHSAAAPHLPLCATHRAFARSLIQRLVGVLSLMLLPPTAVFRNAATGAVYGRYNQRLPYARTAGRRTVCGALLRLVLICALHFFFSMVPYTFLPSYRALRAPPPRTPIMTYTGNLCFCHCDILFIHGGVIWEEVSCDCAGGAV